MIQDSLHVSLSVVNNLKILFLALFRLIPDRITTRELYYFPYPCTKMLDSNLKEGKTLFSSWQDWGGMSGSCQGSLRLLVTSFCLTRKQSGLELQLGINL